MIEFRFNALKANGQSIVGTISAPSVSEGKKKINELVSKHGLKTKSIEKKSTFLYKVRKGNEKPFTGEQKAFNKQEVTQALTKLGYQVVSVNKKFLLLVPLFSGIADNIIGCHLIYFIGCWFAVTL